MLGVNLTSPTYLEQICDLTATGSADYVEILIDNFLSCDAEDLCDVLNGTPVAFHIMNSKFLERDISDLRDVAPIIKRFISVCNPIYVSDHAALFSVDGLPTPILRELDYAKDGEHVINRVATWQDLLETKVYLENFPSILSQESGQPEFFSEIISSTNCGLLFDASNALVAEMNTGTAVKRWETLLSHTSHFHSGGFSHIPEGDVWIDSHDQHLATSTRDYLQLLLGAQGIASSSTTLTIEFDHNIDFDLWKSDLQYVRTMAIRDHRSA